MNLPYEHLRAIEHHLIAAGERHQLDPALLAAVAWRETNAGLFIEKTGGLGDNGHGHGIFQIDDRTWGAWLAANDWRDPGVNAMKGAEILAASIAHCRGNIPAGVCGYNAGPGTALHALDLVGAAAPEAQLVAELDKHTTGHDYVAFVLAHWRRFGASPENPT